MVVKKEEEDDGLNGRGSFAKFLHLVHLSTVGEWKLALGVL